MTSTWPPTLPDTLPDAPPTVGHDTWEVPPSGAAFRGAPTPPPPPPTSSPPPNRRGGGWRAATAVFAALALVGGGYMVRDLTDSNDSGTLVAADSNDTTPSSLPSGTTPAVSGNGDEPVAEVAAAVSPAVVQIQTQGGLGSGTIYDAQGYILTNNHVVGDAETVQVILADGTGYEGTVLGNDPSSDVAVVQIQADIDLPVARLASEDVRVGQTAVALGSPFGLDQTVTAGIVSAVDRPVDNDQGVAVNMIQTDAPINPGNSGGALANRAGEIIGMPTAIFSQSGENNGIGFAVPIDVAKRIADQITSNGSVSHAALGIQLQQSATSGSSSSQPQVQSGEPGAVVGDVTSGGAAAEAGIEAGDRITSVNGDEVRTGSELQGLIGTYSPGEQVTVTFVRDGSTRSVEVTLGSR
jgi:putative serine protease PepD